MPRIGDTVAKEAMTKGVPPVVLQLQPTGYIALTKPEDLKHWEEDIKRFHGVGLRASSLGARACETCSCGCSDDCGMLA